MNSTEIAEDLPASIAERQLVEAVIANNVPRVTKLLNDGVTPNITDADGLTLLMIATTEDMIEMMHTLLAHNASADAVSPENCSTALMFAGFESNLEAFEILLESGADVNIQDEFGYNVLMQVIGDKQGFICGRLEKDIQLHPDRYNLDMSSESGYTAIHQAVEHGNHSMVRTLISAGANPLIVGPKNDIALMHAYLPEIVEVLLDAGCNPNWRDCVGRPCIDYAITHQLSGVAGQLIQAGIDVNVTYCGGMTPLFRALSLWLGSVVEDLIIHGADVNAKDPKNRGALYFASLCPDAFICKYLINHGANPDLLAYDGTTPLYIAISRHHTAVAKTLLAHHVRLDRLYEWDDRFVTVLDMAIYEHLEELCELLYALGCPVNEQYSAEYVQSMPPVITNVIMQLKQPRNLQAACRIIVRQQLRTLPEYLEAMGVPMKLKDYILMSDSF